MSIDVSTQRKVKTQRAATPSLVATLISAVLGGLAAGMLWCFLSVWLPFDTSALIVPIGLLLGLFLRWQGFVGWRGVLCALCAILIAFAYAEYLSGAVRIAQMMGLPFRDALFKAGFALTADIAWANLRTTDFFLLAIAVAIAAAVCVLPLRIRRLNK